MRRITDFVRDAKRMGKEATKAEQQALRLLNQYGELIRHFGGKWTSPGERPMQEGRLKNWVGTTTIEGLIRRKEAFAVEPLTGGSKTKVANVTLLEYHGIKLGRVKRALD